MSEGEGNVVAGLLQTFMRQHSEDMKEIRDRLAKGDDRMNGIEVTLGEVKTIGIETRAETRRTNGRVTALEEWRALRIKQLDAEEDFQRGRKAQRADDMAKLDALQTFFSDWWQTIVGFGVLIAVVAGGIWALVTWPV